MFAKYMSILHHLKLEILEVCPKHLLDQRLWSSHHPPTLFTYRYKVVPQFGIAKLVQTRWIWQKTEEHLQETIGTWWFHLANNGDLHGLVS
jgi:hypothetical protein